MALVPLFAGETLSFTADDTAGAMGSHFAARKCVPIAEDSEERIDAHTPSPTTALRQAIHACRNGGTMSIAGVYGGFLDKIPIGAVMNRSLPIKSGQTHVHRYLSLLLDHIVAGTLDPSFLVTHRLPLVEAAGIRAVPDPAGRLHQDRFGSLGFLA